MKQNYEIILASGSPRRRELLTQAGLSFRVKTADVDETPTKTKPEKVVEELSRRKAEAVAEQILNEEGSFELSASPRIIVAADTIVAMDGEILGKPRDTEDAVRMLRELSGRTHEVYTGVTILVPKDGKQEPESEADGKQEPESEVDGGLSAWNCTFSSCTKVMFYPLSDEEILDYVASGEPMDKAGAYGIQGLGERLVERIEGDYNNVVGFPLSHFLRILAKQGMITYEV